MTDSSTTKLVEQQNLAESMADVANMLEAAQQKLIETTVQLGDTIAYSEGGGFFMIGLTVFVLACFVGYHVVWRVTPALHSPLMGVTNAISSVIIVGAIIALGAGGEGQEVSGFSQFLAFLAVTLASVNIFGGFIITRRMLHMFKKKS
jgi:NAD(P) transhydrogenase subunit alpha